MTPKKILAASALMAALMTPGMASAANLLTNGSFETPGTPGDFSTLAAGDTSILGWTVGGGGVDYIGTYWAASDGYYSIDLNALSAGSISQTLTGLTVGATYNVTFDLSGNPEGGPAIKSLIADGDANQIYSGTFDVTGHGRGSIAAMGWTQQAFSFQATAVNETISFISTTTGFSGNEGYPNAFGPAIDNVVVTTAVPEPATWAMFLLGFGGIGFVMRGIRRKTAAAATA